MSLVPGVHSDKLEEITREFVDHVVGEVATEVLLEKVPSSIEDLEAGRAWVRRATQAGQSIGWELKSLKVALTTVPLTEHPNGSSIAPAEAGKPNWETEEELRPYLEPPEHASPRPLIRG